MAVSIANSIYGNLSRTGNWGAVDALYAAVGLPVPGSMGSGNIAAQLTAPTTAGQIGGTTAQPAPEVRQPPPPQMQPAFNPAYESGMAGINQGYGNAVNRYTGGVNQLTFDSGFDASGRELTAADALFNPFNRMAMLRKSFATANKATSGNMANRGQLYSGALQSRLDNNRGTFDENESGLKSATTGGFRGLLDAWLSDRDRLAEWKWQLDQGNTDFQLENRPPETASEYAPTAGVKGYTLEGGVQQVPRDFTGPKPTSTPPKGYEWFKKDGKWSLRRKR